MAGLAQLKAASSFPPPWEVEEIKKYKLEKNETIKDRPTWKLLAGGNGWELFRTLDLYRHSFNVNVNSKKKKKEKKEQRRGKEEEGENKIVLIDFDGVLASEKTLAGVLLNEVVGLKDIRPRNIHANWKAGLLTAINIWQFYQSRNLISGQHLKGCRGVVPNTILVSLVVVEQKNIFYLHSFQFQFFSLFDLFFFLFSSLVTLDEEGVKSKRGAKTMLRSD